MSGAADRPAEVLAQSGGEEEAPGCEGFHANTKATQI